MAETIFSTPVQNGVQKQLDSTLAAAATSAVLSEDVSALFTETDATHPCVCVIDRIDSNGNLTPTKREYIKFTGVSTTTLTGLTRNADGSGSDQEHAVGAIVEFVPDVLWAKSLQDNYVDTTSTQTISGKTLTSPVINTGVSGTAIVDEDTMTSNSDTKVPTQQSVKAYVDTHIADTTTHGTTGAVVGISDTQILTNKTLVQKVTAYTPAGAGTSTIDLTTGNIHTVTMPAATQTLAISNEAVGQCFIIEINNVTSQGALTWFTTIRWADGTAPTLTGTNGKRDVFGFRVTGADTYDGFIVGQNL